MSQAESTPPGPVRPIAYCNWHQGLSDTARLIRVEEAATGPGGLLYACDLCQQKHGLTPLADQT
ncbi:hypothetical protein [Streptomyces ossamyceticus]|uniref:hypothetical protein n=1 Tax=Streptomyces ossamyceticus TaxID=249581 RepID=UPI003432B3D4